MKREKITERFIFSEEEKEQILKKSGQKCAHCGKPIFVLPHKMENAMTVDHYIPLYKGGSNRSINFVPLCKECNEKKSAKIINPAEYLKFLKPQYMKELQEYYESYIHSFNYLSENNLFANDEFIIEVPYFVSKNLRAGEIPRKNQKPFMLKYVAKKAAYCDLDKLYTYYVRYLKKYDVFDCDELARHDILRWFEEGCIYYIEKNDDILMMIAFDIINVESGDYTGPALEIWPFAYYVNERIGELMSQMIFSMPNRIIRECGVKYLPTVLTTVTDDKIYSHLIWFDSYQRYARHGDVVTKAFNMVRTCGEDSSAIGSFSLLSSDDKADVIEFMKNFKVPGNYDDEEWYDTDDYPTMASTLVIGKRKKDSEDVVPDFAKSERL